MNKFYYLYQKIIKPKHLTSLYSLPPLRGRVRVGGMDNCSLLLLFSLIIFLFINSAYATELEGGVKYDVQSARSYVQEGIPNNIDMSAHPFFQHDQSVNKVVYSYNNEGDIIAATVQYRDEPSMAYIYGRNNRLIYIDKYDRPVHIYPHRGYRYNMSGQLELTSLTVSEDELFRFSPEGKLLVHSINGIMYNVKGRVIGKALKQ